MWCRRLKGLAACDCRQWYANVRKGVEQVKIQRPGRQEWKKGKYIRLGGRKIGMMKREKKRLTIHTSIKRINPPRFIITVVVLSVSPNAFRVLLCQLLVLVVQSCCNSIFFFEFPIRAPSESQISLQRFNKGLPFGLPSFVLNFSELCR